MPEAGTIFDPAQSLRLAELTLGRLNPPRLPTITRPTFYRAIMSSRSLWRSLHLATRRRVALTETPYRCFSCSRQALTDPKSDSERLTHFGFTNVPESKKESMGMFLPDGD